MRALLPNNNKSKAVLPFCDEEQYSTCLIDIDTLGLYYGLIDAFIVLFFLAGYMWVHGFIKDEFETIKKTTVTAGGVAGESAADVVACRNRSTPFLSWKERGLKPSLLRNGEVTDTYRYV